MTMLPDNLINAEAQLYNRASLGQNPLILPVALFMLTVGFCYLQFAA